MASNDNMIAWAAGLFEGEGCINFRSKNSSSDKLYVRLSVRSTDHDILEKFRDVVDAGDVYGPFPCKSPGGGEAKDYSEWRTLRSADVRRILEVFLPYFGERRSVKAQEAFILLNQIRGNKLYSPRRVHLSVGEGV